jgi:hypothetical protein
MIQTVNMINKTMIKAGIQKKILLIKILINLINKIVIFKNNRLVNNKNINYLH